MFCCPQRLHSVKYTSFSRKVQLIRGNISIRTDRASDFGSIRVHHVGDSMEERLVSVDHSGDDGHKEHT